MSYGILVPAVEKRSLSSTFPNELLLMCYLSEHRTAELRVSEVHRNDRRWTGVTGQSQEGTKFRKFLPWWMWLAWSWRSEAGSFRSQKGSVLGLLALLQPCFKKPRFIFSCCITSVQRLQCLWWSGGCCNLPTAGCFLSTHNSFQSLGVPSPAGIAGTELECGFCSLPCSKPKEVQPFGSWDSKAQLGESPAKSVASIYLFFKLCPQCCCSPSCQGLSSVAGKVMWHLADSLILAFWLWLWDGWSLKWERQQASAACDLVRNGSACR